MVDDGPWLYYKLTNEPKGSGELKKKKFNAYRPLKLKRKKRGSKKIADLPTLFQNKVEIVNKTFFLGLMSTHNMFLWRTDENYPSIIIKYPPYLVFSQVILFVLSCSGLYHNMHLNVQNSVYCHCLI